MKEWGICEPCSIGEKLKVAFFCEASLQMSISNDFEAHREILRAGFQYREVEGSEK
jgi:hypothetical protein